VDDAVRVLVVHRAAGEDKTDNGETEIKHKIKRIIENNQYK
jgi:hypothetical protein